MYNTIMFLIYICISEHKHFRCIHLLKSYLKIHVLLLSNIQFYIILFCALSLCWGLGKMQINYCSCFIHVFTTNLIFNNRKNTLINKWLSYVSVNSQHLSLGKMTRETLSAHSLWGFFSDRPIEITESVNPWTETQPQELDDLQSCLYVEKNRQLKTLHNNNKTN